MMENSLSIHIDDSTYLKSCSGVITVFLSMLLLHLNYILYLAIYNLYLHPLRNIPGPKLWITFPILRSIAAVRGTLDGCICDFHETYGPVVRSGVNNVTFTSNQAWKDIYGYGHQELPKFTGAVGTSIAPKIISANTSDHSRYRKALLPAFSERALREQEPILSGYVSLLIGGLQRVALLGTKTDMVQWYTLTTFDIIGDLAFGESLGGLHNAKSHEWIDFLRQRMRLFPLLGAAAQHPLLFKVFLWFTSNSIKNAQKEHLKKVTALTMKRLNNKPQHGRGDFIDHMMKSRGQKGGLSDKELASNADALMVAGSGTTAALLCGVTYWLLRSPSVLARLCLEIRSVFLSEDDICFNTVAVRLPYMLACLDEALRLYPPVPTVLSRCCLPGPPMSIDGYLIPEMTSVGVHHTAAYWSSSNFYQPKSFIPERWLPEHVNDPSSSFFNDNREVVRPFSYGPRDCIGRNLAYQEVRLILARVLWNFDLSLCSESEGWENQRIFALWEKPPLWCELKHRKRL